jgi:predicted nucleotide-binding protein
MTEAKKRILVVEDDALFASHLSELLDDRGLDCTIAVSAEEALAVDLSEISGAIIDVMLPNDPVESGISNEEARAGYLTGVAVARRLRESHPDLHLVLFASGVTGGEAHEWADENGVPYVLKSDGARALIDVLRARGLLSKRKPRAFVVHGHDEPALQELKNYLRDVLCFGEVIVLRDMESCGRTIIEKFEGHALDVDTVFVLLTPDDVVVDPAASDTEKRRARQNVVFEMGFFYGALGRLSGRVIALCKGPTELPSDIAGVVWVDISTGIHSAGERIRMETADILSKRVG